MEIWFDRVEVIGTINLVNLFNNTQSLEMILILLIRENEFLILVVYT